MPTRNKEHQKSEARAGSPACSQRVDWKHEVDVARRRIRGYLTATPQLFSEALGVQLKLESLQVTGSYKVRGALNAMLRRQERGDHRPVVCASAGNHAQGAAWAAQRVGSRLVVVMPANAPRVKVLGARRAGAEVVLVPGDYQVSEDHARQLAGEKNFSFLSAFDEPAVIAGQASVGLEILAHAKRPDAVVVPVGGGGLASGVCLALRNSGVRVVGVQVEGLDAMARLMRGQRPLKELAQTWADGVRVRRPGKLTRVLCQRHLDDLVVVSERQLRQAMRRLAQDANVVSEGAGAVALAGLLKLNLRNAVAVVSGGNVDPDRFASLLTEGDEEECLPCVAVTRRPNSSTQFEGNARC